MGLRIQNYVRIIAGLFITAFSLLGYFIDKKYLFVTIFIGLNLFQFGFTNKCPLSFLLKKIGIKE